MAMSRFATMICMGQKDKVVTMISNYAETVSSTVSSTGKLSKVLGTTIHISKGKKISFVGKLGDKRVKREMAYFRMVFLR